MVYNGIDIRQPLSYYKNKKMLQQSRQILFQDSGSSLDPRMKVCDIITEPLRIWHMKPKRGSMQAETEYQMRSVGLPQELSYRYPSELSGGQRQRVAIARALASNAKVLLADEPTGNLDEQTAEGIIELLKQTAHELGKCVIVVTHSKYLANEADEIVRIANGVIDA